MDTVQQFVAGLPFRLDPFQCEAIDALNRGSSVLVAAPTGTGKTVIGEFAVHRALSQGLRALYTTPIKALSNQKFRDFRSRYGDRVGLLTGDLVENPDGRLLVMTTEVARNMLIQAPTGFRDVGCLVFDEVHYLADPERGTAWEESILLAPPHLPLVCLSATVANAGEIADWMRSTGREVALIESELRAVPLQQRYYLDGALYPILDGSVPQLPALPRSRGADTGRSGKERDRRGQWRLGARNPAPGHRGSPAAVVEGVPGKDRAGDAPELPPEPAEVLTTLAAGDLLPALYFMFSRRAVEEAAESCRRLSLIPYRRAVELRRLARERVAILPAEDRSLPQVERLLALLPRGIGFHHAGLLPPLKSLVEELLADGWLQAVFATDTLALGINVPARSVVVGEMIKFDGQSRRPISPGEYRQLTGRAGRRGMDPVGYSVLLPSPWVGLDRTLEIATGEILPLESAFRPGYSTVLNLDGQMGNEDRLAHLIAGSLRQFQKGGRIQSLAREQEELSGALSALPSGCPLDGGPVNWLAMEKSLQRDRERAESLLETARREQAALEERISAWPWGRSRGQKKSWLSAAWPGEMAFSRRHGWMIYLGPSSEGIALFLSRGSVMPLVSHSELDYLPDPPIPVELPEGLARTLASPDAARQLDPLEISRLVGAMERLPLPDLEAEAREIAHRGRLACAGLLDSLEERISSAQETLRQASQALARIPCRSCDLRNSHRRIERQRRQFAGTLAGVQRELEMARGEARRNARRLLWSLRSTLERFGYLASDRPTGKAELLRQIFDSSGLIIAELLDQGVLSDASPAEIAEVASWFAFDRDRAGHPLSTTARLSRIRVAAEAITRQLLEAEQRFGLQLSRPMVPEFRGIALAWVGGATLSDLSGRSGLAEGDIVFALQKSIDLCRQIARAASHCRTPSLARRAAEAEGLLRRGVVEGYYRWVVG